MVDRLIMVRMLNMDSCASLSRKMGKHKDYIAWVESGRKKVTVELLLDYSKIYKVPVNWLMGLQNE